MRLVIINPEGDEYTYSFDAVIPFDYESAEQLLVDTEMSYCTPTVSELESWFKSYQTTKDET